MDAGGVGAARSTSGEASGELFHLEPGGAGPGEGEAGWQEASYLALRRLRDHLTAAPVAGLARLGVPPSAVSVTGVAAAATLLWTMPDRPVLALAAFLAALLCDAMDGALARRLGRASRRGKLVDQACDLATCGAVLGAAAAAGLAGPGPAAAAWGLLAALLAAAFVHNSVRDRPSSGGRRRLVPRGGFFAHLPKAPLYGAAVLWLAGGPDLLAPAVAATGALAGVTCAGFLGLIALAVRRRAAIR